MTRPQPSLPSVGFRLPPTGKDVARPQPSLPLVGFRLPPIGGDASGPAKPVPRRLLERVLGHMFAFAQRVSRWDAAVACRWCVAP